MSTEVKFKVGDRVRNALPEDWQVRSYAANTTEVLVVRSSSSSPLLEDINGKFRYACAEHRLEPVTPTLDTLSVDDVVVDDMGEEFTVAAVIGRVIILEDEDGHALDVLYTVKELKDNDYTVKQEDEVVELTLEDVAKLKGVPVGQIRIKEAE